MNDGKLIVYKLKFHACHNHEVYILIFMSKKKKESLYYNSCLKESKH